jgi:hypothetical protein
MGVEIVSNWTCEMCRWNVNGYGEKLANKWRIHPYCYRNGCQFEPKTFNQTYRRGARMDEVTE